MIIFPDMDILVKIYKKNRKKTTVQDSMIKLTPQDRNVIETFAPEGCWLSRYGNLSIKKPRMLNRKLRSV